MQSHMVRAEISLGREQAESSQWLLGGVWARPRARRWGSNWCPAAHLLVLPVHPLHCIGGIHLKPHVHVSYQERKASASALTCRRTAWGLLPFRVQLPRASPSLFRSLSPGVLCLFAPPPAFSRPSPTFSVFNSFAVKLFCYFFLPSPTASCPPACSISARFDSYSQAPSLSVISCN